MSETTTDDVRAGQVWRDRDKRSPHTVVVLAVHETHATCKRGPLIVRIRLDRLPKRFKLERDSHE